MERSDVSDELRFYFEQLSITVFCIHYMLLCTIELDLENFSLCAEILRISLM
jgi:hypothetical protein